MNNAFNQLFRLGSVEYVAFSEEVDDLLFPIIIISNFLMGPPRPRHQPFVIREILDGVGHTIALQTEVDLTAFAHGIHDRFGNCPSPTVGRPYHLPRGCSNVIELALSRM